MRKLFFLLLFIVNFNQNYAQIISNSVISNEHYYINPKHYLSSLNESKISEKILIDLVPMSNIVNYYDGFENVKTCTSDEFKEIYRIFRNSFLNPEHLLEYDTIERIYYDLINSTNIYSIAGINGFYNKIKSASIENGAFVETDSLLQEINSNYESYSSNKIFTSSILNKYVYGDNINFIVPKGLWYISNEVIQLSIDFGNGEGFQNINFDEVNTIEYNSACEDILVKMQMITKNLNSEIDTLYSHFTFYRKGTTIVPPPDNVNEEQSLLKSHPNYLPLNQILYYPTTDIEKNNSYYYYTDDFIYVCTAIGKANSCAQYEKQYTGTQTQHYTQNIKIKKNSYPIEYCFYFNPNNKSGKLRRPFIVCDGFDPGNTKNYHSNNSEIDPRGLYEILNGNPSKNEEFPQRPSAELVSKLQALGYDIVFVNFLEGAGDIPSNAESLRGFFNNIINKEYRDENTEEIILVGPSMAGLITRYALAKMEENKEEHYVRQWISFDSPQKGANVAIGLQWAIKYLSQMNHLHLGGGLEKGVEDFKKFVGVLDTKAAKQMLLQHYSNFGSENNAKSNFKQSSNKAIGPHQDFINFYKEIEALNNNKGYPCISKRYAISNGGNSKRWEEEGAQIIKFKLTNWTYVRVYANHNRIGTFESFWGKRQDNPFGEGNNDNDYQLYTANQIGYENAPGGGYVMTKILNQNEKNIALDYFNENLPQYTSFTFMPTSSTFGVKVTRENVYKTWQDYKINNLATPFDEIFGMVNINEDHVQITSKTADDILISDILKDDFNNCTFPYNRPGEQNTKTISNKVMYKAGQTITFAGYGNNCIVKSGAITHVKASNKITFLPGFKVENGAYLYAATEPISMNQASLLKTDILRSNSIDYSKPLKYSNIVSTYTSKSLIDSISICIDQPYIYPNPCKTILTITIPLKNEYTQYSYLFSIFTPDGKIVKTGTLTQNANTIDVSDLAVGMYLIKIKHGDSIYIERILKK